MRKKEEGWSTLELVIILPFILVLFMAIIQYGLIMSAGLQLTYAVREGARRVATSGDCSLAEEAVKRSFPDGEVEVFCEMLDEERQVKVSSEYKIPLIVPFLDLEIIPFPERINSFSIMLIEKK